MCCGDKGYQKKLWHCPVVANQNGASNSKLSQNGKNESTNKNGGFEDLI
jgi:hypothetical protein